jgi:outer membrane protein TolC
MEEMLRANLDLRAAEARLAGARAARREAALGLAPTGGLSGSYTWQRLAPASFPNASGPFPDQHFWDVGFDAAWELDLFGRLRHRLEAQEALVAAGAADLDQLRVSLAAELARAYFELRGAQDQLAVARRNTENQKRTLDLTRKRLENPEFRDYVLGNIATGRLARPGEIAAAVVYLASEEAAMVNGAVLSVDGGWTAR